MRTFAFRVRAGQLAFITRAPGLPAALGAVVTVIERTDDLCGMAAWAVEVGQRLTVVSMATGREVSRVRVPDAWMTPIAELEVAQ